MPVIMDVGDKILCLTYLGPSDEMYIPCYLFVLCTVHNQTTELLYPLVECVANPAQLYSHEIK